MGREAPRHFIRQWRQHRGLTQDALAEKIGLDRSYLSNIERGVRRYDQPFIEAAAAALGCTVADLICRDPKEPADVLPIWAELTATERKLLVEIAETIRRNREES